MSTQDSAEFGRLVRDAWPDLGADTLARVVQYRELVVAENGKQNLTRILEPREFLEGNVLDVRALLESGFVEAPAMDLGSGAGIPGMLAAIVGGESWVLCESEGRKAEFLAAAAETLGLKNVKVTSERAEKYLLAHRVESVVVRAVGSIEKIYRLLRPCSTWNKLVLLKGPRWEEEWVEFQSGRWRSELEPVGTHAYSVADLTQNEGHRKARLIIQLRRVPRGTKKT